MAELAERWLRARLQEPKLEEEEETKKQWPGLRGRGLEYDVADRQTRDVQETRGLWNWGLAG